MMHALLDIIAWGWTSLSLLGFALAMLRSRPVDDVGAPEGAWGDHFTTRKD